MIQKVLLFNDKDTPMKVRVVGANDNAWQGEEYLLDPHKYRTFKLEIPDDCVLYVKTWTRNQVFISFMNPEVVNG